MYPELGPSLLGLLGELLWSGGRESFSEVFWSAGRKGVKGVWGGVEVWG